MTRTPQRQTITSSEVALRLARAKAAAKRKRDNEGVIYLPERRTDWLGWLGIKRFRESTNSLMRKITK